MAEPLPLAGARALECTHMVMGPTCGMILADLGAEVVKVEPIAGDSTRRLLGSGAGFLPMFNRNKRSLALDVQDPRGREIVLRLLAGADVFSENFKAGTMDKLGLGWPALRSKASACRCAGRRLRWASTAWRCCRNWATTATRSRPCARPVSWACRRQQTKQA